MSIVATALAVPLGGCASGADEVRADDAVFAGLPPAVVAEVLDSPHAADVVAGVDEDLKRSMYQGMVRNVVLCRAAFSSYEAWRSSGVPQPLGPQPVPATPMAASDKDMAADIERFEGLIESGDISLLQTALTAESGCGGWVPAKPGDITGPTIADLVGGES